MNAFERLSRSTSEDQGAFWISLLNCLHIKLVKKTTLRCYSSGYNANTSLARCMLHRYQKGRLMYFCTSCRSFIAEQGCPGGTRVSSSVPMDLRRRRPALLPPPLVPETRALTCFGRLSLRRSVGREPRRVEAERLFCCRSKPGGVQEERGTCCCCCCCCCCVQEERGTLNESARTRFEGAEPLRRVNRS